MQIFIARPDKSHGPYSLAEVNAYLASGHLTASDMAWFAGCAGWMPLPQVPGALMPAGSVLPPSMPPAFTPQQVAPQQAPFQQAPFQHTDAERTLFEISPAFKIGHPLQAHHPAPAADHGDWRATSRKSSFTASRM